jgi:hypothetical protein
MPSLGDRLDVTNGGPSQRYQGTFRIHAICNEDGVQGTVKDGAALGVWYATA